MKRKRLIAIFGIFIFIVIAIVLGSTIFAVHQINYVYKNEFDQIVDAPSKISIEEINKSYTNKSIFLLNTDKLALEVNAYKPSIKVIGVVRNFPSIVNIYYTNRIPVIVVKDSVDLLYTIDLDGYVVSSVTNYSNLIRIDGLSFAKLSEGQKAQTAVPADNYKLDVILNALKNLSSLGALVDHTSAITSMISGCGFESGDLYLNTVNGCKILIKDPVSQLQEKIIGAFSVFKEIYRDSRALIVVYTNSEGIIVKQVYSN